MRLETVIGLADQPLVKSLFADPGFIPRNEQDCLALRVEGKGYSPFAISRTEPQFLHVRVVRVVERAHPGPSELRSELLQEPRQRQNFRLHVLGQFVELRLELVANLNNPDHIYNMVCNTYDVNSILIAPGRSTAAGTDMLRAAVISNAEQIRQTGCRRSILASFTVFCQLFPFVALTWFWASAFARNAYSLARLMGEFFDCFLTVVSYTAGLTLSLVQ